MKREELIKIAEDEFRIFERMSADTGRELLDEFKKLVAAQPDESLSGGEEKTCKNCKYKEIDPDEVPCFGCWYNKWEPKV